MTGCTWVTWHMHMVQKCSLLFTLPISCYTAIYMYKVELELTLGLHESWNHSNTYPGNGEFVDSSTRSFAIFCVYVISWSFEQSWFPGLTSLAGRLVPVWLGSYGRNSIPFQPKVTGKSHSPLHMVFEIIRGHKMLATYDALDRGMRPVLSAWSNKAIPFLSDCLVGR